MVRWPFMGDLVEARVPLCNLQQCPQLITLLLTDFRRLAASDGCGRMQWTALQLLKATLQMVCIVLLKQSEQASTQQVNMNI